jgi:hypothetical protein
MVDPFFTDVQVFCKLPARLFYSQTFPKVPSPCHFSCMAVSMPAGVFSILFCLVTKTPIDQAGAIECAIHIASLLM